MGLEIPMPNPDISISFWLNPFPASLFNGKYYEAFGDILECWNAKYSETISETSQVR